MCEAKKNIEIKSEGTTVYNVHVEAIECLIFASRTGLIFGKEQNNANKSTRN